MKNLTLLLLSTIFTFASINSEARSLKRWTRTAEMKIEKSDGVFANVKSAVFTELGYVSAPQSAEDYKTFEYEMKLDDKAMSFSVVDAKQDGCGSVHLKLRNKSDPRAIVGYTVDILFVDHSLRRCRDIQPYKWEARVKYTSQLKEEVSSNLVISGNPSLN